MDFYGIMLQQKLAKGGGAEVLIINTSIDDGVRVMDKTFTEIKTAFTSGVTVLVLYVNEVEDPDYGFIDTYYYPVVVVHDKNATGSSTMSEYSIEVYTLGTFSADSVNDYPYLAS